MTARPETALFHALNKIAAEQPHATDDMGWPICECEACLAKRKRMDDAYMKSAWAGNHDPERNGDQLQRDLQWDRNNGFMGE